MKNDKTAFVKDLVVLILAMAALVFAAVNLHFSLNMLGKTDE